MHNTFGKVEDPTALPLCIIVLWETTPCIFVDAEVYGVISASVFIVGE